VLLLIERQWLYAAAEKDPNAFFDVTEGQNKFGCCHAGFPAAPGWVQPLPEQREPGKKKKTGKLRISYFYTGCRHRTGHAELRITQNACVMTTARVFFVHE
jgi:hypothetical protein